MLHPNESAGVSGAMLVAGLAAMVFPAPASAAPLPPIPTVAAMRSMASGATSTSVDPIFASRFEHYLLTIDDYLAWCSVSVDGGASSISPPPAYFNDGHVVALQAQPASASFVWGYWTGTDGDNGGHDTNATTTVTMSADKNVFACCPFSGQSTCP